MAESDVAVIAPPSERRTGRLLRDGLLVASAGLMALTLYLVFMWVPSVQGLNASRIFYFHVPLGWLGMVSIVAVAVASGMHLITKKEKWDSLAYAIAELGVFFISLLLVTGIIWNKATWGVWWTWDPKLTTTLILWFIYASYLMLRAYGPMGSQGARYGAVVALIGAIDTPIIYMAANWWNAAHPSANVGPLASADSFVDSRIEITLLVSLVTFTVMYIYMLIERYSLRRVEAAVDELYRYAL